MLNKVIHYKLLPLLDIGTSFFTQRFDAPVMHHMSYVPQKKKAAEDAAEAKKKASRKCADCLLEEAGEDEERSDKDSLCESPPTSRRRLRSPERNDKGSNMVKMILDGSSSENEDEDEGVDDQVGEGGDEDYQDPKGEDGEKGEEVHEVHEGVQNEDEKEFAGEETVIDLKEEDQESNKPFASVPRSKVKLSNLNSPRTKRIAISAHKAMHLHVVTVNSFPSALDRE
ncbi:hypothetical protein P692DRAFT_20879327 [Suillus brevipes Sb2]|nr:hypothetical protein P692DRAFT_20879327 [Suillus brevipes Sb2]